MHTCLDMITISRTSITSESSQEQTSQGD